MRSRFIHFLTVLLISIAVNSKAQPTIDSLIIMQFNRVVGLIENDSTTILASFIEYPLIRENPLPNIASAGDFIKYYPILFDSTFKQKLKYFNDSDIFEHYGDYGLVDDGILPNGDRFDGDLWMNDSGMISRINYSSLKEQKLSQKITQNIKSEIYPSVNDWETNVEVLQSSNYLIRIDRTAKGIRYISWGKGKKYRMYLIWFFMVEMKKHKGHKVDGFGHLKMLTGNI